MTANHLLRTTKINSPTDFESLIIWCKQRAESALDKWLPPAASTPDQLHSAMRYSALAGGKYIRPLLVYATGKTLDVATENLDGPACAVELIHAYSLIHDDLPAMDDDDLRRGKPTNHKVYGEAIAILSGDALQSLAFHILANDPCMKVDPGQRLRMIDTLAVASGSLGMAGGQAIDLTAVGQSIEVEDLEYMHTLKTGALIRASIKLGMMCSQNTDDTIIKSLNSYAKYIGLAFQIRDDILDVEGNTQVLGKTRGSDAAKNKPTYPSLLGLEGAKQKAYDLHDQAMTDLECLDKKADPLRWISDYIVKRSH
ncbi:MAG: (2E,6E)-farnesyl diphosphate synthase [Gammaproteobacteria bacterium]